MGHKQILDLVAELSENNIDKPPLIIELAGTPNSGKTSLINELENVFGRFKIKCKIICETAQYCKISNKKSPEFNYWTALETIQRIMVVIDQGYKLILCDRGIFDALTWLRFYYNRNLIGESEYRKSVDFYLLSRWRQFVHYIILITCEPNMAIQRDSAYKEFEKYGTIVNPETLEDINNAINNTKQKYESFFNRIITYDTTKDIENIKSEIKKQLYEYLLLYMQ